MSTGSQGDSSSTGESDEDESESSSSNPVTDVAVGQDTLRAVYRKWGVQTAAEHSDTNCSSSSEPDTIFHLLSKESTENFQQDEPIHIAHIAALPYEVLLNIFRWAVGSHLDTRILGKLAQVCRGFYILSCDPCLWRSICLRQWPELNVDETNPIRPTPSPQLFGFVSWKDMAIRRPHVLHDGCYLCRITYVRSGESQFSDCCRQFHLVVYYRGIRFYPDGRVCMLTSTYAPNAIVSALGKLPNCSDNSDAVAPVATTTTQTATAATVFEQDSSSIASAHNGLLNGTYEWCDPNFIVCTLFRPRTKDKAQPLRQRLRRIPDPEVQLTFRIRFRLASSKRRLHSILHWDSYVIQTQNLSTQNNYSTSLDVSSDQFPSCHFSPVRSYTSEVAPQPI